MNNPKKNSRDLIESSFDKSQNPIFWVNAKGKILHANPASYSYLGYSKEEFEDKHIFDVDINWDKKYWVDIGWNRIQTSKIFSVISSFKRKDGTTFPVSVSINLIKNSGGDLAFYIVNDITEQKIAESELEESEKHLKLIFDTASTLIVQLDTDFTVIECNKEAERIHELEKRKIIGKNYLTEFFDSNYHEKIKKYMGELIDGKSTLDVEFPITTKSGITRTILWNVSPLIGDDGKPLEIVAFGKDITDRKKAEQELQTHRDHLHALVQERTKEIRDEKQFIDTVINSLPSSFYMVTPMGELKRWNKKLSSVSGLSHEELSKSKLSDIIKNQEKKIIETFLNDGFKNGSAETEAVVMSKDGEEKPHFFTCIKFDHGKNPFLLGVGMDITKRKKAENMLWDMNRNMQSTNQELFEAKLELEKVNSALEEANSKLKKMDKIQEINRIKDEFLSITTHELKTPLTPLKMQVEMWQRGSFGNLGEKQKSSLEIMSRNILREITLIDDIMTISKLDQGKLKFNMAEVDLLAVLKNVHTDMSGQAKEKNLQLKIDVPNHIPLIWGDQYRLMQVIVDLINNALKFTEEGEIKISAKVKDEAVQIEVSDTGIGIPKKEQESIFQRFYQVDHTIKRKYYGSGLGLAIVKGIIKEHGGEIWVKSKVGEGSTFYFTLPIHKKE